MKHALLVLALPACIISNNSDEDAATIDAEWSFRSVTSNGTTSTFGNGVYDSSEPSRAFVQSIETDISEQPSGDCDPEWAFPSPPIEQGVANEVGGVTISGPGLPTITLQPSGGFYSGQVEMPPGTYDLSTSGSAYAPATTIEKAIEMAPAPAFTNLDANGHVVVANGVVSYSASNAKHLFLFASYRDANSQPKTLRCALDIAATSITLSAPARAVLGVGGLLTLSAVNMTEATQPTANGKIGVLLHSHSETSTPFSTTE